MRLRKTRVTKRGRRDNHAVIPNGGSRRAPRANVAKLGTALAACFAGRGLDRDIEELRAEPPRPALRRSKVAGARTQDITIHEAEGDRARLHALLQHGGRFAWEGDLNALRGRTRKL